MKKALTIGTIAAIAALTGCSSASDKPVFLQCVDEASKYVWEYKIIGQKIWTFRENKWDEGSEIKFSRSTIRYRDYIGYEKSYNDYTLNRLTGVLTASLDVNHELGFVVGGMVAKCSPIDEDKLRF